MLPRTWPGASSFSDPGPSLQRWTDFQLHSATEHNTPDTCIQAATGPFRTIEWLFSSGTRYKIWVTFGGGNRGPSGGRTELSARAIYVPAPFTRQLGR